MVASLRGFELCVSFASLDCQSEVDHPRDGTGYRRCGWHFGVTLGDGELPWHRLHAPLLCGWRFDAVGSLPLRHEHHFSHGKCRLAGVGWDIPCSGKSIRLVGRLPRGFYR